MIQESEQQQCMLVDAVFVNSVEVLSVNQDNTFTNEGTIAETEQNKNAFGGRLHRAFAMVFSLVLVVYGWD